MKNASEMRRVMNQVIEQREEARRQRVHEYVETEIMPQIEENANKGFSFVEVAIDGIVERQIAKQYLIEFGYEITNSNTYGKTKICW